MKGRRRESDKKGGGRKGERRREGKMGQEGSHGWLYEALQIIVRILAFTLRKIGTLECFRQRNDRI